MSVTTTATSVSYIYQEGEVYSLPYEYQNEADVKASYIDSDGNKVNLAYNVDYTVGGSTVTLIAALPDGVTITFSRQTEITQQTELPQQTITKAIETAIDKNTMCVQEIATDQGTLRAEFNAFTANINQTIVRFEQSFDEFKISINQAIVNLEQNFDEFEKTVNQSITNFEQNFNDFKKEVNQTVADAIAEVEAIKETAITEMNDIKDETQNIANNVNVFIPFVNNGTLSWTNEAGLPNPAPVNIKGEQGSPGKDGVDGTDGTAATITIGTVTTGEPGSNASVTNVGTDTAAVLDISIPRGDKGVDGTGLAGIATTEEAIAGESDTKAMTPLKTKEAVAAQVPEIMQETLQNKADLVDGKVPTNQLPEMDYVPNSEVGNAANKIPKYNASGHLVLPNGAEFWIG